MQPSNYNEADSSLVSKYHEKNNLAVTAILHRRRNPQAKSHRVGARSSNLWNLVSPPRENTFQPKREFRLVRYGVDSERRQICAQTEVRLVRSGPHCCPCRCCAINHDNETASHSPWTSTLWTHVYPANVSRSAIVVAHNLQLHDDGILTLTVSYTFTSDSLENVQYGYGP